MSYNDELQSNNAGLEEILQSVNELPDAGGNGNAVFYVTITRSDSGGWQSDKTIAEILNAYSAGYAIKAKYDVYTDGPAIFTLTKCNSTSAYFEYPTADGIEAFRIDETDGVQTVYALLINYNYVPREEFNAASEEINQAFSNIVQNYATKEYVDNAVSNSGGKDIESIDVPGDGTVEIHRADGNIDCYPFASVYNVKTVNGTAPDENGNVEITIPDSGGNVDQNAVLFTEQELTPEQQAQARANIGVSEKSAIDSFMDNVDVDYAFDAATNANYTAIRIYRDRIDGTKQFPFVYAPNGTGAGTKSTYDLSISEGWLFAINAGVFDLGTGKPDGLLIQDGVLLQDSPSVTHEACKPLTIDAQGYLGYASSNKAGAELVNDGIVSAVCGFMPIIIDYEAVPESDWVNVSHNAENTQRQIFGQFGNGDYAVITCEGRGYNNSDGWTMAEAQAICQKHGLKFAYNLDGGGSTETMLGKKHINTIYNNTTGRIVPTFIVFNGTQTRGGAVDAPDIPEPYTFVDYLLADGNQYIDTGISESNVFSAEYEVMYDSLVAPGGHTISSKNTFYLFHKDPGSGVMSALKICGNNSESITNTATVGKRYIIRNEYDGNVCNGYVNDALVQTVEKGQAVENGQNYHFFAYGADPTAVRYRFVGKLYYAILRDVDGSVVHNFKPAKRNADGKYGLYDSVTNTFFTSHSGTDFPAV